MLRLLRSFLLILPLAACLSEETGTGGLSFLSPADQARPAEAEVLRRVSLFGGDVVVEGPDGYCIDQQSLKKRSNGSFVLIASCESLSGRIGAEVAHAVVTVSILPRRLNAEIPTTADILASSPSTRVLAAEDGDGISLIQFASGGDRLLPEGDPRFWRAGMLINGHVVGLAVYGPKGSSLSGPAGRRMLIDLAETMLTLSPLRDYSASEPVDLTESG